MDESYRTVKLIILSLALPFLLVRSVFAQDFEVDIEVSDGATSTSLTFGIAAQSGEDDEVDDEEEKGLNRPAPPPPPAGAFDARFTRDGGLLTDIRTEFQSEQIFTLKYQASSGEGPVVFTWNTSDLPASGTVEIVDDVTGQLVGPLDMTANSSLNTADYESLGNTEGSIRIRAIPAPPNRAPALTADTLVVEEDSSGTVDVRANDTDPDGDALTLSIATPPSSGTAAVDDGGTPEDPSDDVLTYTPDPDFNGSDAFSYRADDGSGNAPTADVAVTVTPVNDAPVPAADTGITTAEGTPVTIDVLANDSDVDGDELRITGIVTDPAHGTATIEAAGTDDPTDDRIRYVPSANYSGADQFTYEITDGRGETSTAAVEVTIKGVNDAPVVRLEIPDQRLSVEADPFTVSLDTIITDGDGEELSFTAESSDPNVGTAVVDGVMLTVDAVAPGTAAISISGTDGEEATASTAFELTVPGADLAVSQSQQSTLVTKAGQIEQMITVSNEGPDKASGVTLRGTLSTPAARASADPAQGSCSVASSTDEVECQLGDLDAGAQTTVDIALTAPSAAGDLTHEIRVTSDLFDPEDSNNTSSLTTTIETDGDGIADNIEQNAPNNGDGNNDGTPDVDQDNVVSLPNAENGEYLSVEAPAGQKISGAQAVNNPSPDDAPGDVDFPVGFLQFSVTDISAGGATTVTLHLPPGVTATTYWQYGPTPGNTSPHWYEFSYDGTTGAKISGNQIVLHFVDGQRGDRDLQANGVIHDPGAPALEVKTQPQNPNQPPTAGDDESTTEEDTPVLVDVLSNDDDPDGDPLTITAITSGPGNGTAEIDDRGTPNDPNDDRIEYTPDPDFNGVDRFTYEVDDGSGGVTTASVRVRITAVNDPPGAASLTSPTDGASLTIQGDPDEILNIEWEASSDPEGDEVSYTWQLARSPGFTEPLMSLDTGSSTSTSVEYGMLAGLLTDEGGLAVGESATFYHRVVADDADDQTAGDPAEVTLTRGQITSTDSPADVPDTYALAPAYPNPFNPTTTITYSLPSAGYVYLSVHNALGEEVATLVNARRTPGRHSIQWQAAGHPSGTYFYRLQAGDYVETRMVLFLK